MSLTVSGSVWPLFRLKILSGIICTPSTLGSGRIFFVLFFLLSGFFFSTSKFNESFGYFIFFFFHVSFFACAVRNLKVFFVSIIYFHLTAM